MGYAFISYSTRNQSLADAMRELLKECGIETWMAPGDIPVGSKYAQVINRAVKESSCFVLMLSEEAQKSVWVAKEVERAVNYRKPIFPVQIENVVLNDEFELYISTDQVVAIQSIDKESNEIKRLVSSIKAYTGGEEHITPAEKGVGSDLDHSPSAKAKRVELTVWSPVNTDVYLNDRNHLVMRIDRNSGFDYKFNSISVAGRFDLIFVSKGFEKRVSFDTASVEERLDYRLEAILSEKEIYDSFDREEAIGQIGIRPSAYAFEQLEYKGESRDIDLLVSVLQQLTGKGGDDHHNNYLIATCARALGILAVKFNRLDDVGFIADIYERYEAKSSYGWMFDSVLKELKNAVGK